MRTSKRIWILMGAGGQPYSSPVPGQLGGHRKTKIYGRLDCRAARQAIARGGYVTNRIFFASENDARSAGFRPCAVCMPAEYAGWKAR
jgi:methylphosphotriester-DNA--protein-cysteine methyltransferase